MVKQSIKLSRDLRMVLENVSVHERNGEHATGMNGEIKTLERRGLIERKFRSAGDPLFMADPLQGWGLTSDGRATLGLAAN